MRILHNELLLLMWAGCRQVISQDLRMEQWRVGEWLFHPGHPQEAFERRGIRVSSKV